MISMDAEIGIIGGSGFYSLLENAEEIEMRTEYGAPSDKISIGMISGRRVAFIPRHGKSHRIPPQRVPYRANIAALNEIGVKRIIATNAVGSLKPEFRPSEMVFLDQYVNMTHGRDDTFFDNDIVAHVSSAEPYCEELRGLGANMADKLGIKYHKSGTIVVINGPRFSTKAESRMFSAQGFDTIGMTQYPEVALAREKEMCYASIALVTDYDVGLEGRSDIKPVSAEEVGNIFNDNVKLVKELIRALVPSVPKERSCKCKNALDGATFSR